MTDDVVERMLDAELIRRYRAAKAETVRMRNDLSEARRLLEEAVGWEVRRKRDGAHWFEMKPELGRRIKKFLAAEALEANDDPT